MNHEVKMSEEGRVKRRIGIEYMLSLLGSNWTIFEV